VSGSGFQTNETVRVEIFEGPGLQRYAGPYLKGDFAANDQGNFQSDSLVVDSELCCAGAQITIRSTGKTSKNVAQQQFQLT
jgi:azurin